MLKGVLLGFACYAAYSISDAFVKLLEGTLPAYEVLCLGALLMLVSMPAWPSMRCDALKRNWRAVNPGTVVPR